MPEVDRACEVNVLKICKTCPSLTTGKTWSGIMSNAYNENRTLITGEFPGIERMLKVVKGRRILQILDIKEHRTRQVHTLWQDNHFSTPRIPRSTQSY